MATTGQRPRSTSRTGEAAGERTDGEIGRFMGVLFAHERVRIHGYSRLLTDLGTYTPETFLAELGKRYTVTPYGKVDGTWVQHPAAHRLPGKIPCHAPLS